MALKGDTSDLDRFNYGGEPILPEQGSYSVTLQGGVVSSDFEAGLNKQFVQFQNSAYQVNVNYVGLDGSKIWYIENFLNKNRGQKFIASLLIGNTEIEEFVVQYLGRPKISKTGFNGSVSLTLQVEPAIDTCWNDWAYWALACRTGGEWVSIFNNTHQGVLAWP